MIFASADDDQESASTSSFTLNSPPPRTFTGAESRTACLATKSSTVTLPPSGKSSPSLPTLTTWYSTRNGFLKPRSLGRRMWIGICPPSKPAATW